MQRIINFLIDRVALFSPLKRGLRYAVDRFDGLQYGSYGMSDEVALALSMAQICPSGAVIDAGANKGDWSRTFLVGNKNVCKLIMIEPAPIHFASLEELVNSSSNTFFEGVAVGAESGALNLYFDSEGSGLSSLYERDLGHIGVIMRHNISVPVLTLDEIVEKHELSSISFLKLDLEGHEIFALKGAAKLLKNNIISALAFEFGGCNIDSRTFFKDFWSLLVVEHCYKIYRILPNRQLLYLSSYSETLERFSWQNFLACAPGICPTWPIKLG